MNNVLVIGSVNHDVVIAVDRIPSVGETIKSTGIKYHNGGKGANQAVASAKSGVATDFIAAIGDDNIGEKLKASLVNASVNVDGVVEKNNCTTGQAFITVSKDGDNSIVIVPGANDMLSVEDIKSNENMFESAKVLLVQLEVPMDIVEYSLKKGREYGLITILNPAPAINIPNELYKYIDILTPNEKEIDILIGEDEKKSYSEKAMTFIEKGVKRVIVTLGENGAMDISEKGSESYTAYKSNVTDTTGAGDCFNGYLAAMLAEGKSIKESIIYANKAASLSVAKAGAQESIPSREEVEMVFK
ncbi:MAG: ribokinase [Clostridium sp.]|uniref:ribokinase n=1 Tax=Clostridium sp. TaxID=1506 RepID=UPI00303A2D33